MTDPRAPTTSISVLGELTATRGGASLPLGGPQQRLVLAMLVARAPEPITVERLQDAIWGDVQPNTARRTVQVYVSNLRKVLGDGFHIRTGLGGYSLDRSGLEVDADMAAVEVQEARGLLGTKPDRAEALAKSAVGRWRGAAYAGLRDSDVLPEARRLDELHLQAKEVWFSARFAAGETDALLPDLEAHCIANPLRESPHGLLMRVLAASGRTSEALGVFRGVERVLAEELGIEPSSELRQVEERILLGTGARPGGQLRQRVLPAYVDDFVGRGEEIRRVRGLISDNRLVTLLGPGGTGKTRLAIEVAGGVTVPVTFVPLDGLDPGASLLAHLAASVDVDPLVGVPADEALAEALGGGPRLLVLDNCEHVVAAVAEAALSLLHAVPDLSILTTSRIALGLPREVVFAVPTLSMPEAESPRTGEAVELFVRRATTRNPGFEISDANEQSIAEICRSLDGLPLALELAASRMDLLSPQQLKGRLGPVGGVLADRRVEGRHHAMEPNLDWSIDLLGEDEELLLRRMGVFRGPFDLDAVESVCAFGDLEGADVLALVGRLADHSMVQVVSRVDGRMGYRLLIPLREVLEMRMGEAEATELKSRHVEHVRSVIEDDEAPGWPLVLSAMRDDLNHALDNALDLGEASTGLDMALALRNWWWLAGQRELGLQWTERLMEYLHLLPPDDRAAAIHLRATALYHSQRLAECLAWTDRFVDLRRERGVPIDLAAALSSRGILLYRLDRLEEAEVDLEEAVTFLARAGEIVDGVPAGRLAEAVVLNHARVVGHVGRTAEALDLLRPLIDLSEARGPGVETALALYHQADLLRLHGDAPAAAETAARAMSMAEGLALPYQEWSARLYYVHALADLGEDARAAAAAEALVTHAAAHGEVAEALLAAGRVIPDDFVAAQVLGATRRSMDRSEVAERWARRTFDEAVASRRRRLPGPEFDVAFERGRAIPGPAAIRLAASALRREPQG